MTQEEIREIVKITIDELTQRKLITQEYPVILKTVEKKIKEFFNNRGDGNGVSYALKLLLDDPYVDIIFLQYRDGKTIDWVAEYLDVEVRTIMRNKKRLITKIYEILEEIKCIN